MKSVYPINWDPNALTITSINFNKGNNYSPWVDRVFGSKAFVQRPEFEKFKFKGFEYFKQNFSIPSTALWSPCSVELLGFGRHDVDEPLTNSIRMSHPATGYGSLYFGFTAETKKKKSEKLKSWSCLYRGLHDTWRFQNYHTKPNFWAVFFYCYPTYHDSDTLVDNFSECENFRDNSNNNKGYTKYAVQMNLRNTNWTHTFYGNIHYSYMQKYGDSKQRQQRNKPINYNRKKLSTAVCLVLTYAEPEKLHRLNGAFLVEFLRYYTMLGMKIFIYDRDGSHQDYIYGKNHYYKNMQNITFPTSSIIYHNFTIRDHLDGDVLRKSDPNIPYYDRIHLDSTDDDKTNTLTHCRMEAKVSYNIDQVLVVDTDELMYCPQGDQPFQASERLSIV